MSINFAAWKTLWYRVVGQRLTKTENTLEKLDEEEKPNGSYGQVFNPIHIFIIRTNFYINYVLVIAPKKEQCSHMNFVTDKNPPSFDKCTQNAQRYIVGTGKRFGKTNKFLEHYKIARSKILLILRVAQRTFSSPLAQWPECLLTNILSPPSFHFGLVNNENHRFP